VAHGLLLQSLEWRAVVALRSAVCADLAREGERGLAFVGTFARAPTRARGLRRCASIDPVATFHAARVALQRALSGRFAARHVWVPCVFVLVVGAGCAGGHRGPAVLYHPGSLSGEQAEALGARIKAGERPQLIAATLPEAVMPDRARSERAQAFREFAHDFNEGVGTLAEGRSNPHVAGLGDLSGVWRSSDGLRYTIATILNGYSIVEDGELVPGLPPLAMAAGAGTYDGTVFSFRYNTLAGTTGHCALRANRQDRSLRGTFSDPETDTEQAVVLRR